MQVQTNPPTQPLTPALPTGACLEACEPSVGMAADAALIGGGAREKAAWSVDFFHLLARPLFYPFYQLFRWISHDDEERDKREREERSQRVAEDRQVRDRQVMRTLERDLIERRQLMRPATQRLS